MDSGPGPEGPSRNDELFRLSPRQSPAWNPLSRRDSDLVRRVHEHKSKILPGFTKQYGVDRLVWFEIYDEPATAISRNSKSGGAIGRSGSLKSRIPNGATSTKRS
jgi:hypothetical protein